MKQGNDFMVDLLDLDPSLVVGSLSVRATEAGWEVTDLAGKGRLRDVYLPEGEWGDL